MKRIVAFGGGGLEGTAPVAQHFIETFCTGTRVCFIPTASGDDPGYIETFFQTFSSERFESTYLPLFTPDGGDLSARLMAQDAIYVGGGNTANMLAIWRLHGVDRILRDAWEAGILLMGSSAGGNCWFEASSTDSFGPQLSGLDDGLGFLPGSFCPHYDGEERRRPTYHALIADGFPPGYAADEMVGLYFEDTTFIEAVAPSDGPGAYRVERAPDGSAAEEPVPTRSL